MFLRFHHAAIICSNYQQSKHFYTNILGFSVLSEHYRSERGSYKLDLQLPSGDQIELFSFPTPPPRVSRPEACGLRHLAFVVDCVQSVSNCLEKQNIEVEPIRVDEYTGKKFTFFSDPDGLPLEIYES